MDVDIKSSRYKVLANLQCLQVVKYYPANGGAPVGEKLPLGW